MAIDVRRIKFFVEGEGDQVFVRDILKLWYGLELTKEELRRLIIICGGYDGINNDKQINEFKEIEEGKIREGGKNIVIFDADYSKKSEHHGYNQKLAYLQEKKNEFAIDFETFLFPDNANDGTIETLLETCINPKHIGILNCWNEFQNCVTGKGKNYNIPADKSKIYVYLECLPNIVNDKKDKIKDRDRDFTEKEKWIIDVAQNPFLKELKTFLDHQLQDYNR